MDPAIHHQIVAAGAEEEFHIVELATRRLTAQADMLIERLPADSFSLELQRSVREELRAGQHQIVLARLFGRGAQAVAEFEFGLEEVGLQPGHGLGVEVVQGWSTTR